MHLAQALQVSLRLKLPVLDPVLHFVEAQVHWTSK